MQVTTRDSSFVRYVVPTIVGVVLFAAALVVSGMEKQAHDRAAPPMSMTQVATGLNVGSLKPGQIGHVYTTTPQGAHMVLALPNCPWLEDLRRGPWQRRCLVTDSQHDRQLAVLTASAIQSLEGFDQADRQALADGQIIAFDPHWSTQRAASRTVDMAVVRSTKRNSDNWPIGHEQVSTSPIVIRTVSKNLHRDTAESADGLGGRAGYRFAIAQSALPAGLTVTPTHQLTGTGAQSWDHQHYGWSQVVIASGLIGIASGLLCAVLVGSNSPTRPKVRAAVSTPKNSTSGQ